MLAYDCVILNNNICMINEIELIYSKYGCKLTYFVSLLLCVKHKLLRQYKNDCY